MVNDCFPVINIGCTMILHAPINTVMMTKVTTERSPGTVTEENFLNTLAPSSSAASYSVSSMPFSPERKMSIW